MPRTYIDRQYDVVIVGSRVAGASTAMLLSRAGMRVLVLEKSAAGTDTTSTHALMRAGVLQLHRWGILGRIEASGTPAIRRTTFHYGDEAIEIDIKERDGIGALYAPRRTVFDALLVEAAREAGSRVVFGATVQSLLRVGDRVTGVAVADSTGEVHPVRASLVIGADGVRSMVAREVNAPMLREGRFRSSVIYGYFRGIDLDGTHWHFGRDVAAGAIPTNDGLACVFASMRPQHYETMRLTGVDGLFNSVVRQTSAPLAEQVSGARLVGKLHPYGGRTGFVRQAWGPGWALVGDAGCFKDPLTAHGMTDALRDAEFLAQAVLVTGSDALAAYQAERDAFAMEVLEISDRVGSFDWDYAVAKGLHHQLSRLITRECDHLLALDSVPATTG